MGLSTTVTIPPDIIYVKCTCGRNKATDKNDLVVILEEDGYGYHGNIKMSPTKGPYSKVMCIREGCKGEWRSKKKYVAKLPRMSWLEFNTLKNKF